MNVSKILDHGALFFPQRPALSEENTEITYGLLNEMTNRIATSLLKLGVKKGDHVCICYPTSAKWITFYYGIIKMGGVAVALSHVYKKQEIVTLLETIEPAAIFTTDDKLEAIEKAKLQKRPLVISDKEKWTFEKILDYGDSSFNTVDAERDDVATILFTGGTTGTPKGAMLTHENLITSYYNVAHHERSTPEERALCFMPLNHVFGLIHVTGATIFSYGCLEILPSFDMDKVLWLMEKGRLTKFFAVPTVYVRLLSIEGIKEKLGRVHYFFSAASSMPAEVVKRLKEVTGFTIHESYGMTETASQVTFNHYYRHKVGSVGTPVPNVEVQIRNEKGEIVELGKEGEICIRGRNVMKGYFKNPSETEKAFFEGGWLRSGDVGIFDDEGYLYIVDRLKDMIITGGENVYPREIEELLYAREEIEECAVVGLPDKEWGERVTAFIAVKKGKKADPEELKTYLKSHLASYKVPKSFIFLDELPKSTAGKILKRELRNFGKEK